jgi:hypothetical protein
MAIVQAGSFTSDGNAKVLELRSDLDFMYTKNYTQLATTQSTGRGVMFEWQRGMADAAGIMISKEDSANTVTYETISAGGFTLQDTSSQGVGAAQVGTAVTAADPAVVSDTSHPFSTGDVVRVYGTTGMLQISGMDFEVADLTANTYSLRYLDASGFAAAATAITARKVNYEPQYYPRRRFIVGITAASSAVIKLSVSHGYTVGQKVGIYVPDEFGMSEINGQIGEITAIDTTNNTVTVILIPAGTLLLLFPLAVMSLLLMHTWSQLGTLRRHLMERLTTRVTSA